MTYFKYLFLFLTLMAGIFTYAQEVSNIRVEQENKRVKIIYDLSGDGAFYKISLYYNTADWQEWQGPLQRITGDAGEQVTPGQNKTLYWDVLAEKGGIEGNLQFKIVAEGPETFSKEISQTKTAKYDKTAFSENTQFIKAKTWKTIYLTTGIITAGSGLLSMLRGNSRYSEYKTAVSNAGDLHRQIQTFDIITPAAFGITGICAIGFIVQTSKTTELKKQLGFSAMPECGGGRLLLTFNF